jgi:hypothetical protein
MRTILPLAVALFAPLAVQAAPPFPGGLLDSTGRTVYASTREGVAAVDLASGDFMWQTRLANQPLLVAGDRLYALVQPETNHLLVRGFDLGSGKGDKVFESSPVEMPRWAVPHNRPGHSFSYRYRQDRNRLEIAWQVSAGTEGGPGKEAAGLAVIDLDSGKVRQGPGQVGKPAATAQPRVPPRLEKLAVRWQRSLAGQLVALVVEEVPGSTQANRWQRLVLRSWNERTGKENTARELIRGRRLVFMAGLDDRHLWVRDAAGCPDEPSTNGPGIARHWSVFAAVDGNLVARVPFIPGTRSATIIDERAYCLSTGAVRTTPGGSSRGGRVLHAVDLTTGKVIWSRAGLATADERRK